MLQLLGLTAGLTLSVLSHAVGMGGINVVSALGQPLKAEIELVAVSRADKPGLVARLASPDAYKGAGLDYPYGIKYSFQVESRANGEPYLKLSSNRELNDPFVSLLVELSWASGKLMREYTFLLDPPGYVAQQPKPAAVQPQAPAVETTPVAPEVKPEVRIVEKPVEKLVAAKPVSKVVAKDVSGAVSGVAQGSITVRSGDTLNKIAAQVRPDNVSLDRMLVALYRANAEQFDARNMNRIKVGKILRMPDQADVAAMTQAEAAREIHVQADDWHAYRQKLASAATQRRPADKPAQVATGKIAAPAADKTPVASESAKEVLRLSKGEAPGDKAGGVGRSQQDKRNAAAEEAIAKAKADSEEKTRLALLESNLKDMERLAKLKSEAAALAAAAKIDAASSVVPASAVATASEVAAASEVLAASAVAPASHVVAASHVALAEVAEPNFVDELVASPSILGGAAAALIGLGGLAIAMMRRRKKTQESKAFAEEKEGATTFTGQLATPVIPSPDTGDFTTMQKVSHEALVQQDEVDAISEADLFLNFGRDEQAEEVLKDALLRTPDNQQLRVKLMGIYQQRQDADAFEKMAEQVRASGDAAAIGQAELLAAQLASANETSGIEEATSATMLTPALAEATDQFPAMADFSVPDDEPIAAQAAEQTEPAEAQDEEPAVDIDFDVTSTHPSIPAMEAMDFDVTATSPSLAAPDMLDFDLASDKLPEADAPLATAARDNDAVDTQPVESLEAPELEESLPDLDDLIFDVTSAQEPALETEPPQQTDAEDEQTADDAMEFTLDFPLDDIVEKPVSQPATVNLADISLDLDDLVSPQADSELASPEKSEHWHEVATKLDLARAYQEMGDAVGAREILDEVLLEGDAGQQQEADLLIKQLG